MNPRTTINPQQKKHKKTKTKNKQKKQKLTIGKYSQTIDEKNLGR